MGLLALHQLKTCPNFVLFEQQFRFVQILIVWICRHTSARLAGVRSTECQLFFACYSSPAISRLLLVANQLSKRHQFSGTNLARYWCKFRLIVRQSYRDDSLSLSLYSASEKKMMSDVRRLLGAEFWMPKFRRRREIIQFGIESLLQIWMIHFEASERETMLGTSFAAFATVGPTAQPVCLS